VKKLTGILLALTIVLGLTGFGAIVAAAQGNQGILEIQVKDHRDAIGDFEKLIINIDKIAVSPKAGLKFWQTGWKELAVQTQAVDLTQYLGNKTARVFRATMESGQFDAFHLKLKSIEPILRKNPKAKVAVKNTTGPFKLNYEVRPGAETLLILDLVVSDMSDHPPRGYELSLKGYELLMNGKLIDKIPPG
jgi:hypothetical protein